MISVYVAAPYACAPTVRATHRRLEARGLRWTSRWAELATGPENLGAMHYDAREHARAANHDAIRSSGALLVLGEDGGCETLVELGVALAHGLPVVWIEGRLPLSATCPSVCARVRSFDEALAWLEERSRVAA